MTGQPKISPKSKKRRLFAKRSLPYLLFPPALFCIPLFPPFFQLIVLAGEERDSWEAILLISLFFSSV